MSTQSLWFESSAPRAPLQADISVDIAIVGAGYTGLWTAYWLTQSDPSLSIAIIDKHHVGFGASGRNGGWASGLFPASRDKIARLCGSADKARTFVQLLRRSVSELGEVLDHESIDADFAHGGTLTVARTALQWKRAQEDFANGRAWGDSLTDLELFNATQARDAFNATDIMGATYSPHCAALNPGKLVRGLARVVESRGVAIYEQTPALSIHAGRVRTPHATLRARYVVRATEGYTESIEGQQRRIAPIWSLMIATEPLSQTLWDHIGLAHRQTFSEYRNVIIYGQRTADGRLAFGGRGAPYHFNSRTDARFDHDAKTFHMLRETLCEFFPALRDVQITHQWGGPLGISRDWFPSVGLDAERQMGWSGSYVGDGVTASFLGGRTLADLLLGKRTTLTDQPWVNHRSPAWEQEPFRWIGINVARWGLQRADDVEFRHGRPSLVGRAMQGLIDS